MNNIDNQITKLKFKISIRQGRAIFNFQSLCESTQQ